MTVQFTCECCGRVETVPELPDEVIQAPVGWRRIKTVIDEFSENRSYESWESEYVHSCDDCNAHMSVDEHIEAEVETRRKMMRESDAIALGAEVRRLGLDGDGGYG